MRQEKWEKSVCLHNFWSAFKNCNPHASNTFILNERSETLIEIDELNKNIVEGICPEMNVCDGVFLAKSLVKVTENGKCLTTILNTNNYKVKINKIRVNLEPFQEESSFVFNINVTPNPNPLKERIQIMNNNLRLDHLNTEEKSSILEICHDYNDIFSYLMMY